MAPLISVFATPCRPQNSNFFKPRRQLHTARKDGVEAQEALGHLGMMSKNKDRVEVGPFCIRAFRQHDGKGPFDLGGPLFRWKVRDALFH